MMEQSAVVQRALDVLRAVCIAGPETGRIARHDALEQRPVSVPAFQPNPLRDPAGWFVNGKRETVFPHCPRCTSYSLCRKNNVGTYECMTCGQTGIEESTARRLV